MQSFGKMAATGMAGLLLFDMMIAVGVTSMSTVSNTTMMSIRSNGCKKTSAQSSSDSGNSLIDKYIAKAEEMAKDDKIGYSQSKRKLNPDVDCSSFVYYALTKGGVKNLGDSPFNTSSMDDPMSKAGFTKTDFDGSADKLQKGDVVWRDGHTEIYIGDNKTVGAHEDTDGKDGDSKGDEVSEVPFDYGGGKYTSYYRLSDSSASSSSDSSSSDSSSSSSSSDFKTNDVAIKIAKAFASAGFSKAATAGVLGNVYAESGFVADRSSPDNGYGLGQWTPRSKIRTWMDANGLEGTPDSDEDGQIKMLVATAKSSFNNHYLSEAKAEITVKNDSLYDTWHEASDPEVAAVAWMAGWERPNWASRNEDNRKQVAKNYYDKGLNDISFNGKSGDSDDDSSQCCTQSDDTDGTTDTTSANVTVTNSVQAYTDKYGQAAFDIGKKYGIPYEAILGQSAVESAWGASNLTTKYHNFFGIKAVNGQKSVKLATKECNQGGCYDTTGDFAVYDSDEDGFAGYGKFITENSRYATALQKRTDPHAYIQELKNAGYATDNNYVSTVWGVTQQFIAYIKQTNKFPPSSEVQFDSAPPADTGGSSSGSSDDSDANTTCPVSDDSGSTSYGSVGGAPTKDGDFSWMCSGNQKICSASDAGVFYPHLEYGHQCVWYAWNRLAMIHGNEGWSWVMGNGGDIANNLKGQSGWTVDGNPKPGDGISGRGSPFAGGGDCGHVAVVEEVSSDPSGWKIRISEGNRDGSASFSSYGSRWLTKSQLSSTDCQFFRNSNWKK